MAQSDVTTLASQILHNVERVIVGKRSTITFTIVAALAEGHILLEDVPGVAKTMLARALAISLGCSFKRIQCTPDLLPSDITGVSVFHPKTAEFEFRPGPLFTQILLADEINRATPRTQAALLEAMAERRVTADGQGYPLAPPFLVLATQNPVDHEGTFPLPEAQLDRFLMKLSLGYPSLDEETKLLGRMKDVHPIEQLRPVAGAADLIAAQRAVCDVTIDDKVKKYVARIVHATRDHEDVALGASPRATLALGRASQALAAAQGRDFVLPDDVKKLVPSVLGHRLILKPESRLRKVTPRAVLDDVLGDLAVPTLPQSGAVDHFA